MKGANVIVLYGPVAAGKLTVGEILSERLGYKLSHNHLINDLVRSVYERGTIESERLIEEFRFQFYEEVVKSGVNFIITHTYANNFISKTGLSDPEYMKKLEAIFEKYNANSIFVHIKPDKRVLLDRVGNQSRARFRKLTDKEEMKRLLESNDFDTSAPVKNNVVIDNSNLTPEETASKIIEYLH